ncbi:MAG: response regulator [Candidatus Competibacteraceae bacterium]|nr:response regulator [Candidatus Competibacteraceae bacterium]
MNQNPRRILLIEDNDVIRRFLKIGLENEGYALREAGNGHQGLDMMRDWTPDLVVLDMMMPVMDGFHFLNWRNQNWPDIPVLVLTGMKQPDSEQRILNAGASAVLFKPVPLAGLLEQIKQMLPT